MPKRSCASTHAATAPGTLTESTPDEGTLVVKESRRRERTRPTAAVQPIDLSSLPIVEDRPGVASDTVHMWTHDCENTRHRYNGIHGGPSCLQHLQAGLGGKRMSSGYRALCPTYIWAIFRRIDDG